MNNVRRRRALVSLFLTSAVLLYLFFPAVSQSRHFKSFHNTQPSIFCNPIISLTSSSARLNAELPVTLQSLLRQSQPPAQVVLYFPYEDRHVVETALNNGSLEQHSSRLLDVLRDERIQYKFTEDVGPGTKFVPIFQDLLKRVEQGEHRLLDQPIIVLDDDHFYSPALVQTLCEYHGVYPNASVGLRGWRIRPDLHWGVGHDEYDRHVLYGYRLAAPYRVGVLTANEGYILTPRHILPAEVLARVSTRAPRPSNDEPVAPRDLWDLAASSPLLNLELMRNTPAHMVDDIWMAGTLASLSVPRYIVPLSAGHASLDITVTHPLESHMQAEGTTRGAANDAALDMFKEAFAEEGIWYRFKKQVEERTGAKGVIFEDGSDWDEPVYAGLLERCRRETMRLWAVLKVRLTFRDVKV